MSSHPATFAPHCPQNTFGIPEHFSCNQLSSGQSGDVQTTNHPTEQPRATGPSSEEAYAKAQIDAANNLASICALLQRHKRIQSDAPWDWGFAADLGAINEKLEEIRRQLR